MEQAGGEQGIASLRIRRSEDNPAGLRPAEGGGAHGTRLHGDIQCAVGQVFTTKCLCRCRDGDHLGVGGGVVKRLGHVVPLSDDPALADHNGSYRDFILVEGRSGLLQSLEHVFFIDVHRVVRIQKRQATADLP